MPFAENQGVKIHYEVEGDGPPLLLVHGRGWSMRDWIRAGYPDALRDEFQVVLVDCRGFGQSDKPHEPEDYGQEQYMGDMCAVLDELDIDRTHYWGYSMGGKLGWALAVNRPERLRSVVIGEYPALIGSPGDEDRYRWNAQSLVLKQGMEVFVAALEMTQGRLPEYQRNRLLSQDPIAYSCQQLGNLTWGASEDQIKAITTPMFIYTGNDRSEGSFSNVKRTRETAALVRSARYQQFDVDGHEPTFEACDVVTPVVRDFLHEVG